MSVGDLCRRIYCRWGPRGIQTAGCRCAVLTARVTVGSGSSAGVAAAARPPRAAVEPHPAICVAVRGRSARGKVVGGVAWAGCMDPPRTHSNVRNVKRARGPRARWAWSRERADASGARVGRRGGLDAGLVRSGRARRGESVEGWAPCRSLGQRSNLGAAEWRPPVGDCRGGNGDETGVMETVAAITERFQVCRSKTVLEPRGANPGMMDSNLAEI